jgi:hypothetical protein
MIQTTGDDEVHLSACVPNIITLTDKEDIAACMPTGERQDFTCLLDDGGKRKTLTWSGQSYNKLRL